MDVPVLTGGRPPSVRHCYADTAAVRNDAGYSASVMSTAPWIR